LKTKFSGKIVIAQGLTKSKLYCITINLQ